MRLVYKRYAPRYDVLIKIKKKIQFNKILYHRIQGMVRAKALHEQVTSMEKVAAQMKSNREQVYQQIHQLKQHIDQLIHQIAVSLDIPKP